MKRIHLQRNHSVSSLERRIGVEEESEVAKGEDSGDINWEGGQMSPSHFCVREDPRPWHRNPGTIEFFGRIIVAAFKHPPAPTAYVQGPPFSDSTEDPMP
jgi:hypothetical protein